MTPEQVVKRADQMFDLQRPLLNQYQSLAENFYPERADFLHVRSLGTELADNLADSYPVIVRRDLANSFAAMLRDGDWFRIAVQGDEKVDFQSQQWLNQATIRQRRIMQRRQSNFVRATKEGDHDFATFGQTVISVEPNMKQGGLLYRCWHLRDCAWFDDETGQTAGVARKWKPKRYDLKRIFGVEALHPSCRQQVDRKPLETEDYYHVVLPSDMYGDEEIAERFPYVSIFIDRKNKHIVEEKGLRYKYYVIPRFHTLAGSPYAYSPAAAVGLADARTLQAMTHTLLETAERYARPPMVAAAQAITGVVDLAPDGITWVDHEYDERTGNALRPIAQDRGGFPIGTNERARVSEMLSSAFYLNKITLPPTTHEMTAYEVSERMRQYRREVLPLFMPIEDDYNGQLCEVSFNLLMDFGMLGSPSDIPPALQGRDVVFRFESPLTASEQEERINQFHQTRELLQSAAGLDPTVLADVDLRQALRDAVQATSPSGWLFSPEEAEQNRQAMMAQAAAQQQMQAQQEAGGGR